MESICVLGPQTTRARIPYPVSQLEGCSGYLSSDSSRYLLKPNSLIFSVSIFYKMNSDVSHIHSPKLHLFSEATFTHRELHPLIKATCTLRRYIHSPALYIHSPRATFTLRCYIHSLKLHSLTESYIHSPMLHSLSDATFTHRGLHSLSDATFTL